MPRGEAEGLGPPTYAFPLSPPCTKGVGWQDSKGRAAIPGQGLREAGRVGFPRETASHLAGPPVHLGHQQPFSQSLPLSLPQKYPCSSA